MTHKKVVELHACNTGPWAGIKRLTQGRCWRKNQAGTQDDSRETCSDLQRNNTKLPKTVMTGP